MSRHNKISLKGQDKSRAKRDVVS